MADLSLQGLYDQKEREFGTKGAGISRFRLDFIDATNRSIRQMNRDADLESPIVEITKPDQVVENLDTKYEDVISWGISLNLIWMGRRPAKGAEALVTTAEKNFTDGIAGMYTDLKNKEQDADPDDEETDIIGLGHKG